MKRKKVLNIIIISCICIFLFCLYFSKTINNMLLPKVVTVKIADGAIGDNSGSAKRYKNVVPKSCLTTEDGIDYIYIVTFLIEVLGWEWSYWLRYYVLFCLW